MATFGSPGSPTLFPDLPASIFTTPRQFTYHYVHIPPSGSKPTVLILHGFPSIPHDFHHQISHLRSLSYGILAPYLLGYAPTSTPRDQSAYRLKSISADIISLLDHLNLTSPIPAIGHDWGVTLLSRLEYYHPTRISRLVYLTIGPTPFGSPFDLEQVNGMTKEFLGYEGYGYQQFFMDDLARAAKLLGERHDRMEMLMFAEDSTELWKEYFGRIGGLEKWLGGDKRVKMFDGMTTQLADKRRATFVPTGENATTGPEFGRGYSGPLMWYVGLNENINVQDEKDERSDWEGYQTDLPVLMVLSAKDPVSLPTVQSGMATAQVMNPEQQLRAATLVAGHFVMQEKADELNRLLQKFLDKK